MTNIFYIEYFGHESYVYIVDLESLRKETRKLLTSNEKLHINVCEIDEADLPNSMELREAEVKLPADISNIVEVYFE